MKMTEVEVMQDFMNQRMVPELGIALGMMRTATNPATAGTASSWIRGYAEGKASIATFWVQDPILRQSVRNEMGFLNDYYWRHHVQFK